MPPCGIEFLPQWSYPCLWAIAAACGMRLLRLSGFRRMLLIALPPIGAATLALLLIQSAFSRQAWSDLALLQSAREGASPTLVSPVSERTTICRSWTGQFGS